MGGGGAPRPPPTRGAAGHDVKRVGRLSVAVADGTPIEEGTRAREMLLAVGALLAEYAGSVRSGFAALA